ncbi:unnamed protein product [Ilex paraguariensis]|uniref:Uncharacterized protein n=1 Tax=Ilex paraguariensis TaxID=185542 RepID=A0ABC8UKF1_9AQUA
MAATFSPSSKAQPKNVSPSKTNGLNGILLGPTISVVSLVRVLHVFTHHVEARAGCRVVSAVSDGSCVRLSSRAGPTSNTCIETIRKRVR